MHVPSTPLPDLLRVSLVIVACIAGVTDARSRRIPNWLVLAGLVGGYAFRFYLERGDGLLSAFEGMLLAFVIYFPLWLLRGMGAGDVKLMAALGAIAGPGHWLVLFFAASILSAVGALLLSSRYGRLKTTVANTAFLAKQLVRFRAPWREMPELDYRHERALGLPHGSVIAAAVLVLAFIGVM